MIPGELHANVFRLMDRAWGPAVESGEPAEPCGCEGEQRGDALTGKGRRTRQRRSLAAQASVGGNRHPDHKPIVALTPR